MLDASVVELCARCLASCAADNCTEEDLTLSATALARDLLDTHGPAAPALLNLASRGAHSYLDESDLDAHAFAAAHRRLARLRKAVQARLEAPADTEPQRRVSFGG